MQFNLTTAEFAMCYTMATTEEAWNGAAPTSVTTEIYHNAGNRYPRGANIVTSPNVVANVTGNMIYLTPASSDASGVACIDIKAL